MNEKLNIYFQINPSKFQAKMHDNYIIIFAGIILMDAWFSLVNKLMKILWKNEKLIFFDNFS